MKPARVTGLILEADHFLEHGMLHAYLSSSTRIDGWHVRMPRGVGTSPHRTLLASRPSKPYSLQGPCPRSVGTSEPLLPFLAISDTHACSPFQVPSRHCGVTFGRASRSALRSVAPAGSRYPPRRQASRVTSSNPVASPDLYVHRALLSSVSYKSTMYDSVGVILHPTDRRQLSVSLLRKNSRLTWTLRVTRAPRLDDQNT